MTEHTFKLFTSKNLLEKTAKYDKKVDRYLKAKNNIAKMVREEGFD